MYLSHSENTDIIQLRITVSSSDNKKLSCRREAARLSVVETLKCSLGSLKVIENGIIRKLWYSLLFAFHSNYGGIFSRFDTIHERDRHSATA